MLQCGISRPSACPDRIVMPFPALPASLAATLTERGYAEPTAVQDAVLAAEAGRDLLVSAQTGSGKTVAYGLAVAAELLDAGCAAGRAGPPEVLIVAPTRELALQVQGELAWLYASSGVTVVACVGGMDARREARLLANGAHVVVGTPGRLRDHLERKQLDASQFKVAVLDEADEMLDLGFREELEFILDATPAERRTLLFSATIAKDIAALAKRYQRDALRIDTQPRNQGHADIEYRALRISAEQAEGAVVNTLRWFDASAALVFCQTRDAVKDLHARLVARGFAAVALSGELSQTDRNLALQALRDGRARVCVATDVAARGLDLPDLNLVIHADLPSQRETLLHRSGRTGRAGRKGVCVLLVPHSRRRRTELLFASSNIRAIWEFPPTAVAIAARDQEHLLADPLLTEPATETELALARMLTEGRTAEQLATALVRLNRTRQPAPFESFSATPPIHENDTRPRGERDGAPKVPRAPRVPQGDTTWFRINVGRHRNADPKWLLPLICRLGGVTRAEVGSIRIFDKETKFEITQAAAPGFVEAVAASADPKVVILPAGADRPSARGDARPERPFQARPESGKHARSFADKSQAGRSHAGGADEAAPRKPYSPRPYAAEPGKPGKPGKHLLSSRRAHRGQRAPA
jgi:ATP-dependent RNA helicase DeaD